MKVIATYSVGIDHIDLQAAANRNIAIAYTPGINADATADIAMLLMLGASRRAYEGQEMVRTGAWELSSPVLLGWQLTGKALGIVGMGRVGQAVAQRARGFGMNIHYFNPTRLPVELEKGAVFHSNAADLLRVSMFLSLHAPETGARIISSIRKQSTSCHTARSSSTLLAVGWSWMRISSPPLRADELQPRGWTSSKVNRRFTLDMLRLKTRFCCHISEVPP